MRASLGVGQGVVMMPQVEAAGFKDFLDQGLHILFIVDYEVLRVGEAVYLVAEKLDAEAVDGGHEIAHSTPGHSSEMRDFISCAALLVKVIHNMSDWGMPRSCIRWA